MVCRRPRRSTSDSQRDRVLVAIKRAEIDHAAPLQVGVLNVRSLGNKSAAVLDVITGNSLDLFAESPSVFASTPPGYRLFERARPRKASAASLASNHGGICVFVRSGIQVSVLDLPTYKSFELLSLSVRSGVLSFVFIVVYRPDPASALTVNDDFFVDFADALERTSSFAGCILTGDVNVHLDDTGGAQTSRFVALLDDFSLHDVVGEPTHEHGHQLDTFVTRADQPVRSVRVDPPLMSDHSLIVVTFDAASVRASAQCTFCLLYTSPSPRDGLLSRMPSSA